MDNEYEAVIADLETQVAELQMTIAVLRKRAGMSPDGGGGPGGREIHSAGDFVAIDSHGKFIGSR